MQDFDVGARLRQLRIEAGLSQRGLADSSGVPHGQVSMIETNRSSPSVASLRKILGGLGLTMSEFFEPDTPAAQTVFFRPQDMRDLTARLYSTQDAQGRITLRQVGDARAHGLQILHERYDPGADTGDQMLEHASHEGGIVIAGEIEVTVGAETATLKAGDGYLFDSTLPHRFRNRSDREAVIVSACAPPYL
ncbi:MAG: cupin domain-containing protein [Paracoccus sp. (in: a-proteobacteria)]|uniref:cupin domain-containing protein n=1 Tax=Paracoccus sp. TaxID=267 RepID=UPI0026DEADD9|nr:cupin domain-containing protein [Paracoccus sp. (in: a-proteobacteria)]MDO5630204.1 cupin domain-containing protein [Paracoccus sp. (in: a-proteobacteria)]